MTQLTYALKKDNLFLNEPEYRRAANKSLDRNDMRKFVQGEPLYPESLPIIKTPQIFRQDKTADS